MTSKAYCIDDRKAQRKRQIAVLLAELHRLAAEIEDEPEEPVAPPVERHSLSISEFAAAHGVSRGHVYKLLREGMPSFRIGAHTRIVPSEALSWLRER